MGMGDVYASNRAAAAERGSYAKKSDLDAARKDMQRQYDGAYKEMRGYAEKLQTLLGERGPKNKSLVAVRRGELAAIGTLTGMKSKRLSAAPTQADFNALYEDVKAMYDAISIIAVKFSRQESS